MNNPHFKADSKVALDLVQHLAPFWFEKINFLYVQEGVSAPEYLEQRHQDGIYWSKMPAFTIVTPKGNYFPVPLDVNLGDRHSA